LARPEVIAAAMLFLASEDSSIVAGSELLVDGGMCSV
jgi:NAD(P)-dependent dehydrogenase (short-subunit alcohol dehydrogenase family)